MTETLFVASALILPLVLAIVFHEVAHGYVALLLGDTTARDRKRLTLNPIRHVDPIGTVAVPGLLAMSGLPVFGWAKPVPVMQNRLNNPRYGMIAVAAAGPLSNLVLAAVGAILLGLLYRFLGAAPEEIGLRLFPYVAVSYFILINVFLALFNLLPLPPFDGSHIVEGLLPRNLASHYRRLRPFGLVLFFGLLLVVPYFFPSLNIIERVVLPPVEWAEGIYYLLADWVAGG